MTRQFLVYGYALDYQGEPIHVWTSDGVTPRALNLEIDDKPATPEEALDCVLNGDEGPGLFEVVLIEDGRDPDVLSTIIADQDDGLERALRLRAMLDPPRGPDEIERVRRVLTQAREQYNARTKGLPAQMISGPDDLLRYVDAYSDFLCTASLLVDCVGTDKRVIWDRFVEAPAPSGDAGDASAESEEA